MIQKSTGHTSGKSVKLNSIKTCLGTIDTEIHSFLFTMLSYYLKHGLHSILLFFINSSSFYTKPAIKCACITSYINNKMTLHGRLDGE